MLLKILLGCLVAAGAWATMFLGAKDSFWRRAAVAGVVISAYALAADPGAIGHELARRRWAADLGVGLASGVALYVVFWVGEQALVVLFPSLAAEVGDLYGKKQSAHPAFMPVVLALAAPGEELFFRGFLWHRAGVVVALAVYGLVHLPERKVILVVAALVGGAVWGALFAWTGGLIAPLASHLLWIYAIVLWKPAQPAPWAQRLSRRVHAGSGAAGAG